MVVFRNRADWCKKPSQRAFKGYVIICDRRWRKEYPLGLSSVCQARDEARRYRNIEKENQMCLSEIRWSNKGKDSKNKRTRIISWIKDWIVIHICTGEAASFYLKWTSFSCTPEVKKQYFLYKQHPSTVVRRVGNSVFTSPSERCAMARTERERERDDWSVWIKRTQPGVINHNKGYTASVSFPLYICLGASLCVLLSFT